MFIGKQTPYRIKTVLDLYGIGSYSTAGKAIMLLLKLLMFAVPFYFAYSMFDDFEFSFLNILKFIGWFILAHFLLETLFFGFVTGFMIRKKTE